MPRPGDQTRERILNVAEELYGSLGVANVSLRQIRIAADQGNDAAVQYHFGGREGILRALSERHLPRIAEIADGTAAGGRQSRKHLVDVLVRPWAEYVTLGASERSFVKIAADLSSDPTLDFETMREHAVPAIEAAGLALFELLAARMPPPLAVERLWLVSRFALQSSAERARLVDDTDRARPLLQPDGAFIDNLVAMAQAAVGAPVPATAG